MALNGSFIKELYYDKKFFYSISTRYANVIQVSACNIVNIRFSDGMYYSKKLLLGEYEDIGFPVVFKQMFGKKRADILGTGTVSLYLISKKFRDVLIENQITGWKTFDVKIYDKKENEIDGYYGLTVTGRSGPMEFKESEIIEKRLVPHGPLSKYYVGCWIDMQSWDGSDFFVIAQSTHIIISNKVYEIIKANNITNIDMSDISEIEFDEFQVNMVLQKRDIN